MHNDSAALIGIDWGSSAMRVFLIGGDGVLLGTRSAASGSSTLGGDPAAHVLALEAVAGDWLRDNPHLPLLACGMVGSQHGWREAPYVDCPAKLASLAGAAVRVALADGCELSILPGLRFSPAFGAPDVMRGEETQIAGVLARYPEWGERCCIVMPGTHSKWALVERGEVSAFATYMTGELYAVLTDHSVLGRLMTGRTGPVDWQAFEYGVAAGGEQGGQALSHLLFGARTLGLTGRLPAKALHDYLSGLLIGHELAAALAWQRNASQTKAPLALVGETALCERYQKALRYFGVASQVLSNTAPDGLWHLAGVAGLLGRGQQLISAPTDLALPR